MMVSKFLLAASHLAFAASAFIEDASAVTGSVLRQPFLSRAQQPESLIPHAAVTHNQVVPGIPADVAQLKFMVSGKGGPEEVEELEKVVTDLVNKGKSATKDKDAKATPLKPAVDSIKNIINTVMIPNRQNDHKRDQDTLNSDVRKLMDCADSSRAELRLARSSKASYRDASSQHKNCRLTESGEWMEKDNYCRPSSMEVKRLQAEAICAKVEEEKMRYDCMARDYQRITNAELACDAAKEDTRQKQELCDTTNSRYESRKATCDQIQSMMDDAACKHAVQKKDICERSDNCYKCKLSTYDATYRRVLKDEESRRGEWRALKRMSCLMDTFADGQVADSEIDECKAKSHTIPSISYPSVPEMETCTIPDMYPGKSAYKEAEFAGLPPQAKGSPAAGACYAMGF